MTSEFLLDAIGQMDDELVLEAAVPSRRAIPWSKAAGWAAAIAVCVGIAHIPGALPFTDANSGAAAPESDLLLGDVMLDMDTKGDDYEYRSEQESQVQEPSAANKSESTTADSATQGIFEPKFFTERGVYLLAVSDSGDLKKKVSPPENATFLGELAAAIPGQHRYPSTGTQELVGCPVWESEDGQFLYIQFPNAEWLVAFLLD